MFFTVRISMVLLLLAGINGAATAQTEIKKIDSLAEVIVSQSLTGPINRPRIWLSDLIKKAVRTRDKPLLEHLGKLLEPGVRVYRSFIMGQDFSCEDLLLFGKESCEEEIVELITDSTIFFRTQLAYVVANSLVLALAQDAHLPNWYEVQELPRSAGSGFFEVRVITTNDEAVEEIERYLFDKMGVRLTLPRGMMEESTLYVLDIGREGCLVGRWH